MYQSNCSDVCSQQFSLNITRVRIPKGAGKRVKYYLNYDEECKNRRGIVYIKNNDNLCLARAIVVSLANNTIYII